MRQLAAPADHTIASHRLFPATADQVAAARQFLAACLNGAPHTGDAVLCVSEVASNAVQQSRSARPGGHFAVRVSHPPGRLRVEVTDEGGPWAPRPASREHGRGLAIVRALTASMDISDLGRDSPARTVTFEMSLR